MVTEITRLLNVSLANKGSDGSLIVHVCMLRFHEMATQFCEGHIVYYQDIQNGGILSG